MLDFISNINIQFYLLSYLAGAIPFGLILTKIFTGQDIRQSGSGNIGATNVLRVLKETNPSLAKKLALATILLDGLKGVVVLLIAKHLGLGIQTQWAIVVFAVLGHCFSPFLNFEGGKGVATSAGLLAIMLPIPTLIAFGVWLVVAKGLKISSLASLLALVALLICAYLFDANMGGINSFLPLWLVAFIIVYKHVPNIMRLIQKQESKVI